MLGGDEDVFGITEILFFDFFQRICDRIEQQRIHFIVICHVVITFLLMFFHCKVISLRSQ